MNYYEDHDLWLAIARNMMAFGGGFAGCLGDLMLLADSGNRKRLEQTFRDLMDNYHPRYWP